MTVLDRAIEVHRVSQVYQQSALSRDILEYYQYPLSEAVSHCLCFGVGFEYINKPNFPISADYHMPYYFINGFFSKNRRKLGTHLRLWLDTYRGNDLKKGLHMVFNYIRMGRPLMVELNGPAFMEYLSQTGMVSLWGSNRRSYDFLNGYLVCLVGFDEQENTVLLIDSRIETPVKMPLEKFLSLWSSKETCVNVEGEWTLIVVPRHRQILPKEMALFDALRTSVYEMTNSYQMDDGYYLGLSGIDRLINDLNCSDDHKTETILEGLRFSALHSETLYNRSGLFRRDFALAIKEYRDLKDDSRLDSVVFEYDALAEGWSAFFNECTSLPDSINKVQSVLIPKLKDLCNREQDAIVHLGDIIGNVFHTSSMVFA